MSQPPLDETNELQFEVAELDVPDAPAAAAQPRTCVGCRRPIVGTYYAIGDKLVCPSCRAQVDAAPPGPRVGRVLKATAMGLGAGLLGALIWYAVRAAAHMEIGLVAVLVGVMVGKAIRKGSGGRGGRGYQVLAVVLTYCCIAANYVPDVIEGIAQVAHKQQSPQKTPASGSQATEAERSGAPESAAPDTTTGANPPAQASAPHRKPSVAKAAFLLVLLAGIVFGLALAAPFLGGMQNAIGLLIIGIALWQAWKLTARRRLAIAGPYQVGTVSGPRLPMPGVPG